MYIPMRLLRGVVVVKVCSLFLLSHGPGSPQFLSVPYSPSLSGFLILVRVSPGFCFLWSSILLFFSLSPLSKHSTISSSIKLRLISAAVLFEPSDRVKFFILISNAEKGIDHGRRLLQSQGSLSSPGDENKGIAFSGGSLVLFAAGQFEHDDGGAVF